MADVFVSYARKDKARVRPLVEALIADGFDVFWDHDLYAGDNWLDRLEKEIDTAKAVLVVWTEASINSDFVRMEAKRAIGQDKLAPCRLDAVEPPLGFNLTHAQEMVGWRAGDRSAETYRQLGTALGRKIGDAPFRAANPQALAKHKQLIRDGLLAHGYSDRITRMLDAVETRLEGAVQPGRSILARAFTFELLNLTLLLAVAYPVLALLLQFALTGADAALAGVTVIDASRTDWWLRAAAGGLVALPFAFRLFSALLRHRMHRAEGAGSLACAVAVATAGAFAGAFTVAVAFAVAFTLASEIVGRFVLAIILEFAFAAVVALVCAVAVALLVAFLNSGAFVVVGAVAVSSFVAFASAGAGVSASEISVAAAVAVAAIWLGERLRLRAPSLVALALAALVGVDWVIARVDALPGSVAFPPEQAGVVLLFLALLPIVNGAFDFLSIGLTRALLRVGAGLHRVWTVVLGLLDLVIGAALFVGLGCASIWLVHEMRVGGDGGTTLIDLGKLFAEIRADPQAHWWLYATYFSTLIPTLFHGGAIAAATLDGLLARGLLDAPAGATEADLDARAVTARARLQLSAWLALPIGVAASVALVWLFLALGGGFWLLDLFEAFAAWTGALDAGPRRN